MKKRLLKIGAVIMALCTLCTASSLTSFAASKKETATAKTVYYTENGENIGIKSIDYNNILFYDCVDNTETELNSKAIRQILTSAVTYEDADGNTGTITPLTQWANIASAIFENGGKYTCTTNYKKYYGSNYTKTSNEDVKVSTALANPSSISNGSKKKDNYHTTGLCQTSSFSELRNIMCKEISNRINRYSLDWKDILGQGDYNPDALPELADTTQRDIYYNIVTSITREGISCKYKYNSYGIAFYDFDLKVIDAEGTEYVQDETKTTTGKTTSNNVLNTTKNEHLYDVSASTTTEISTSESVSTSVSNNSSYSFSEMFGGSAEVSSGFLKGTLQTQLTTSQVYESVKTEGSTCVNSISESKTVNYTVPAHTVIDVEQSVSETSQTVSYDTPVALTYKVAVFSMSGDIYADSACTLCISTAGYEQSNFSTFFGGETSTEGLYAIESLNNRVDNADTTGWDATYGNNHVFYKKHDGYSSATNTTEYSLDWNKICSTYDSLTKSTDGIKDFASKCPMLPEGTTTTMTVTSIDTTVSNPKSMYLPTSFKVINNDQTQFTLYTGGSFNLNTISVGAFDKYGAAYYDFMQSDGQWTVKEGSEGVIEYDPGTYTLKAVGVGTGTLVWSLKDGVEYTAAYESGSVTNDSANTSFEISFTVRDYPL